MGEDDRDELDRMWDKLESHTHYIDTHEAKIEERWKNQWLRDAREEATMAGLGQKLDDTRKLLNALERKVFMMAAAGSVAGAVLVKYLPALSGGGP